MKINKNPNSKNYLRVNAVALKLSCCISHVWNESKLGNLHALKLSPRVTVWDEDEIDAYMESKKNYLVK